MLSRAVLPTGGDFGTAAAQLEGTSSGRSLIHSWYICSEKHQTNIPALTCRTEGVACSLL